jgi:radical SAM enzyme (TIGR01210 family)
MCDFSANPHVGDIDSAVDEFESHLDELDPGVRRFHLGPGGSFFDDHEVPPDLRLAIVRSLRRLPFLESLGVETRPNVMTLDKLSRVLGELPDGVRDFSIGFGFECLDDMVREVTVNKGYGVDQMRAAFEIVRSVNASQDRVRVEVDVYVLLKPLFLTEQEAIDEAVRTIDWAYAEGAETAALFMNTVKQRTVQGYLAERMDLAVPVRYQPPYLRSAVQVLRTLPNSQRQRTQVLGVQSGVEARRMPRSCPLCAPFLLGALVGHNFTRDAALLEQAAASVCPCRKEWQAELEPPALDLVGRIECGISELEREFGA